MIVDGEYQNELDCIQRGREESQPMIVINKGLNGFLHSLIPSKLRKTLSPNTADYMRARALSAILVSITIMGTLAMLLLATKHVIYNPDLLMNDLISVGIVLLFVLQTVFFYRFNNFWMSALAFTNSYFLLMVTLLLVTGGYDSSIKILLLTCPLVSFVVGGVQEGIQNAVFTIIAGIAIAIFKYIGFDLINHLAGENVYVDFCIHWTIAVLVIVSCALTYDAALSGLNANHPENIR